MNLRLSALCALFILLPACASEVLGAPEEETGESLVSSANEELASASASFGAFYLPASHEALCLFADGSTYRGAAANRDAAYSLCARRAVDAAPGAFDARIAQTRAANGTCTTGLVIDGVARSQRTSTCNTTIHGRVSGGSWYGASIGSQPGLSWWAAGCFYFGGLGTSGISLVTSCFSVALSY